LRTGPCWDHRLRALPAARSTVSRARLDTLATSQRMKHD
jgi:hypothetical protein